MQQLKYVVTVARTGSMSEASKELFISQPGLTTSIRELETEMGIKIFTRTNKGVVTSNEGERFLGYARQVLEQASLLEGVYKSGTKIKQQFCVSTQHYSFAVNAFVDLIRRFAGEEYDFSLRETETYEIIDDVAKMNYKIKVADIHRAFYGKASCVCINRPSACRQKIRYNGGACRLSVSLV